MLVNSSQSVSLTLPLRLLAAVALAAVGLLATGLQAQTFSITDPTASSAGNYTWAPLLSASGGYLLDPANDQQTGQTADDYVSSASNPGFFMRYGQINGVDSVAFRLMENTLTTDNKGNPSFTGQASIGLDTTGDGAIDIVFTVIGKNSNNGINYQAPGSGTNDSPNTTTLGTPTLISAFNASNFSYTAVNSTNYPGWTQVGTDPDAMLTFSLSFASLNAALNAVGKPSITTSTLVRFIAFTSTQTNAINQDVYGSTGISGATRFDAPGGGFTDYTDSTGKPRPTPEPATGAAVGVLLAAGLMVRHRRRSRADEASADDVG